MSDRRLDVHPVTPERWPDLVSLFERPGPRGGTPTPGSCWCMWWRARTGDAAKNKSAMRAIVLSGQTPGLLAYCDRNAVRWVSVAPRPAHGQLLRSRYLRPNSEPDDAAVFAITCFYVDRAFKGSGMSHRLVDAAISWAAAQGAAAVEAYPSLQGDYMGNVAMYVDRGFEICRETPHRVVLRLALT